MLTNEVVTYNESLAVSLYVKKINYLVTNISKNINQSQYIAISIVLGNGIKSGQMVNTTANKNILKASKNSEEQLLQFIENTPVALAMFDTDMNYLSCSEQYLEDWWVKEKKMAVKDVIGKNHYEIFPDVKDDWRSIHNRVLAGETLSSENDQFIKVNGKREWLRWKAQPWRLADSTIGGLILFTEFITERKEAEEATTQSRNRLNALIQNLPGLVYRCNADNFKLNFVSSGSLALTGYEPEEYFTEDPVTFEQIVHPEDFKVVRTIINEAILSQTPFEVNYRIYTKNGKLKYINERGQVLVSENGAIDSIEGVVIDVTERMEAESLLRKSKESLDDAQRVSHLGSWEWYLDINEILWSDEYFRICGERPDSFEPTLSRALNYFHPEDRKSIQDALENTIKTGEPFMLEKRLIRRTGAIRYVRSQGELVLRDDLTPYKVIGSLQDITDQKLTEIALEESRRRNAALINALPDLMLISTVEGDILDIKTSNPALLFKPKSEMIGQHISTFLSKENTTSFLKKSKLAHENETHQTLEYTLIIDQKLHYFESRIVKYEGEKVLSVIRDITKSKTDETNLIQLTEKLTTSNSELKQFAYITSHDLRAPVVNIDALLKLYKNDVIDEKGREEVFDKIVASVDQLKSTLNDLIQLVSIKDNSQELMAEVNLEEITQAVINSLETQINEVKAVFQIDFGRAPHIISRKATVYSIIQNLISNALKYASNERPMIKLSSFFDRNYVCISIQDNGLGIDMEKHGEQLFGMYQRFHENKEGKGLGLYIIKSQIEALGGYIDVKSQVNKGSEFRVYFKK